MRAAIPGEIRLGSLTGEPSRVVMKVPLDPSSLVYTRGHLFFGKDSKLFARLVSNCTFDRGSLSATYRKPFDMLVEGNESGNWLGVRDGIRNWLQLGLQPAKGYENRRQVRMSSGGSGEVGISHGASEAEQLFDPERA